MLLIAHLSLVRHELAFFYYPFFSVKGKRRRPSAVGWGVGLAAQTRSPESKNGTRNPRGSKLGRQLMTATRDNACQVAHIDQTNNTCQEHLPQKIQKGKHIPPNSISRTGVTVLGLGRSSYFPLFMRKISGSTVKNDARKA